MNDEARQEFLKKRQAEATAVALRQQHIQGLNTQQRVNDALAAADQARVQQAGTARDDYLASRGGATVERKNPTAKHSAIEDMPPAEKEKAVEAAKAAREAMQETKAERGAQKPVTEGDSNAALRQKATNQDKTQAALSPTDRAKGQTATQAKPGSSPAKGSTQSKGGVGATSQGGARSASSPSRGGPSR